MIERDLLVVAHSHFPWDPRIRKQVTAALDAGLSVDVVCLRGDEEAAREEIGRLRIRRLPVRRDRGRGALGYALEYLTFGVLAMFMVGRLWLRHRHRVVHAHNIPDELVFAALVPRLCGARVMLDIHDFMPELFATRYDLRPDSTFVRALALLERWSCAFAHTVIVTHERGRRRLIGVGVPAAKIVVIMNTAPLHDTRPARRRSGPFTVLYHGILSDVYDLETAVRAIALLREQGVEDVALRLVGAGPRHEALRTLVRELGVGGHVRIEDQVPAEHVPELLEHADAGYAVTRAGRHQEIALPTKMFEMIAHGLPVVTSRAPVIMDHFDDAAVLYVQPADAAEIAAALRRLRDEPELARRLAERAWEATWPIRWQAMAARYVRLVRGEPEPVSRAEGIP